MRTTVWDVIRFAWQLLRMREQREWARIGQMVGNVGDAAYHLENRRLIKALEQGRVKYPRGGYRP